MNPKVIRTKKMAKKSMLSGGQPANRATKSVPVLPTTGNSTSWRDVEELVDYDPKDPPSSYSPADHDISELEDRLLTPEQGSADISLSKDDFGAYPAEDAAMMGQIRRQNFPDEGEQSRKAARDEVAALPRSGGKTLYTTDRDEVAVLPKSGRKPLYTDRDEVAALPKSGRKPLNTDRDEVAALPKSGRKPLNTNRDVVRGNPSQRGK